MENKQKYQEDIEELKKIRNELEKEIIQLDDEILFQNLGLFESNYSFETSELYKTKLNEIRDLQKQLIKQDLAASCSKDWIVSGDKKITQKFIKNLKTELIRIFNIESENILIKLKFHNYESSIKRLKKTFNDLNKLNEVNQVKLSEILLELKLEEFDLKYSYEKKKKEEKDERRALLEQRREEQELLKELEEKRQELEKEHDHYLNKLSQIEEQIKNEKNQLKIDMLIEKKQDLNELVEDVDKALKDLDYREANYKAGYVYIISNIGSFGKDVYKIGMTRRLDPRERINELSGASVPFKFDIHALIFTDDAPGLESALHNAFSDKKMNLVNKRKEFFNVSLEEIKSEVLKNYDKTIEFIDIPDAQQYRESELLKKNLKIKKY